MLSKISKSVRRNETFLLKMFRNLDNEKEYTSHIESELNQAAAQNLTLRDQAMTLGINVEHLLATQRKRIRLITKAI